jgi:hypothetical protein
LSGFHPRILPLAVLIRTQNIQNFLLKPPHRREEERENSENVSALSAGVYTTTWLVMVT